MKTLHRPDFAELCLGLLPYLLGSMHLFVDCLVIHLGNTLEGQERVDNLSIQTIEPGLKVTASGQ
jgi:hypothetical protein